jgi:hypothetical protein
VNCQKQTTPFELAECRCSVAADVGKSAQPAKQLFLSGAARPQV